MTREILFRGFHPDENGKETIQINGEVIRGEWKYGYYFYELGAFIKERPSSVSTGTYLVLGSTVSEFTGLTDKNGKNCFEHNIIKASVFNGLYREDIVSEIVFVDGCYGVYYEDTYKCFYPLTTLYKTIKSEYVSNVGSVPIEKDPLFEVCSTIFDTEDKQL
jgi:hypothetical protein